MSIDTVADSEQQGVIKSAHPFQKHITNDHVIRFANLMNKLVSGVYFHSHSKLLNDILHYHHLPQVLKSEDINLFTICAFIE